MQRTYHFAKIAPTHAEGEVFSALLGLGRAHEFTGGEHVIHRGDPGTSFWVIERGKVMACRFGRDGERILYAVLGPGDLVGELACFGGFTQQVHAIVEGEARLVRIEMARMEGILESQPGLALWLLGTMANKLRTALDRVEGDHSMPARERIARVLANLGASEGPELEVTHQQLADFVGVSRVTVGQVLAQLAAEGAIALGYGRIAITDQAALARRTG